MTYHYYTGDLPDGFRMDTPVIAIDTETQGLNLERDRLCMVQLSDGSGEAHLVHFPEPDYAAPNLKTLLADQDTTKLFHYARFDVAVIQRHLEVICTPVWCTKIASRLVRTYTDRHSLKALCSELINVDLDKQAQSSDWASDTLSPAQCTYAANDVLYLHALQQALERLLIRENRLELAQACFDFLPVRAELDLAGWAETDIFAHA